MSNFEGLLGSGGKISVYPGAYGLTPWAILLDSFRVHSGYLTTRHWNRNRYRRSVYGFDSDADPMIYRPTGAGIKWAELIRTG